LRVGAFGNRFVFNTSEPFGDSITVQVLADYQGGNDTLSYRIAPNKDIKRQQIIPNFIGPNGDGINDELCFADQVAYRNCYQLQIFNRNGQLLFQSKNIEECWQPKNTGSQV
jgi:gliding motility-associated-like protein